MKMTKLFTGAMLLTATCALAFQSHSSTEAVAKQISTLRASVDSFADAVNGRLAAVDEQLEKLNICAEAGKIYNPNNPNSDNQGCITAKAGERKFYYKELSRTNWSKSGTKNINLGPLQAMIIKASVQSNDRDAGCSLSINGNDTNVMYVRNNKTYRFCTESDYYSASCPEARAENDFVAVYKLEDGKAILANKLPKNDVVGLYPAPFVTNNYTGDDKGQRAASVATHRAQLPTLMGNYNGQVSCGGSQSGRYEIIKYEMIPTESQ